MLKQLQQDFAQLINGKASTQQLQQFTCAAIPVEQAAKIYQNNYVLSLIEALQLSYPMTERLVGEEFFKACSRSFVLQYGMLKPCVSEFGAGFAEYLAAQPALSEQGFISEVSKLEWALETTAGQAYQDSSLSLEALQSCGESLSSRSLRLKPQLQLFSSTAPVKQLYDMIKAEQISQIDLQQPCWLVLEKTEDYDVAIHQVDQALAEFLDHCQSNKPLEELTETQLVHLQQHLLFSLQQAWLAPLTEETL